MKRLLHILLVLAVSSNLFAANQHLDSLLLRVEGGDTMYLAFLHDVYVRDVRKTLPYAKLITADMAQADAELATLETDKERRKWWRQYERYLFKKYEKDFRNMYASQGRMLMLLMDRESDKTSYELIRKYKGKASADFWQFIAKLFKNDLKEEYDAADKDRIIERVITLVEAGQL